MLFFFQAEDGIRDIGVTGVQTCALPIWAPGRGSARGRCGGRRAPAGGAGPAPVPVRRARLRPPAPTRSSGRLRPADRESGVSGKRVALGGRRIIKKKKTTLPPAYTTARD